jgi:hypothetical protein
MNIYDRKFLVDVVGVSDSRKLGLVTVRPKGSTMMRQEYVFEAICVQWEFWRITQSQFRYREPGIVDLDEIE